ncbi:MAG: hypothetical protein J2P20_06715 [Pseudonocardia sp.]|nr:hypothetical protein [Pseudonocardia sp.]MBO0872304.1 hypothetical protein [Pseudonocardia sp.]
MIGVLACLTLSTRDPQPYSVLSRYRFLVVRPAVCADSTLEYHSDPEAVFR